MLQRLLLFALEITVILIEHTLSSSSPSPHNICSTYTTTHNIIVGSFSSSKDNTVTITYVDPDGEEHPVKAEIGKHLLDTAHDNNIELEGMYVLGYSLATLLKRFGPLMFLL